MLLAAISVAVSGGVQLVADINPGGSSYPKYLTVFANELYFQAINDTNGEELWKYDGTASPSMVADINPGGSSYPQHMTVFNNELYFNANDGTNGAELWKYDGTASPSMVADINPGDRSNPTGGSSSPQYLTVFNNELYFQAD